MKWLTNYINRYKIRERRYWLNHELRCWMLDEYRGGCKKKSKRIKDTMKKYDDYSNK